MTMEVFDCEQGTEEWARLRCGIVTASRFSDVLSRGKTAGAESLMRRKYINQLTSEIITGDPMETYSNADMERGREMEEQAMRQYLYEHDNVEIKRVGFIKSFRRGCSPDGLIGEDGMVEFKTTKGDLMVDLLRKGTVPSEHAAQCQGNLWVAERKWIDLVIFWPRLPLFVSRIFRDEEYIRDLEGAVGVFTRELDAVVALIRAKQ